MDPLLHARQRVCMGETNERERQRESMCVFVCTCVRVRTYIHTQKKILVATSVLKVDDSKELNWS